MIKKYLNKKTFYILFGIIYTIIFFREHIFLTWDSSVYLGMSLVLGSSVVSGVWHPLRGLSFPLLLRLFEPLGYQNKYLLLLLMYIFFLILLKYLYKIAKDLDIFKKFDEKVIYLLGIVLFILFNPYIFLYYHTLLTEFVIMTLGMVLVYLLFKYYDIDIKKSLKKGIISCLIISLIIVFLYHTKQSFLGLLLLELFLGVVISLFKHLDLKNIGYRVGTLVFCGLLLVFSIVVWDNAAADLGVEDTIEVAEISRVSRRLIEGINELKPIGDKFTVGIVDKVKNEKYKEEINKIIDGTSKYENFTVYQKDNLEYILFTKGNYSLKEQLPLYLKIVITHPFMVIKSYGVGFYRTVINPAPYHFENKIHSSLYYNGKETNVLNVAPGYKYAIDDLVEKPIVSLFDNFELGASVIMFYIYSANMILVPLLFIASIVLYFIIRKKYKKMENISLMCMLLFGLAFNTIISYIMFAAYIDRYLVPCYIPMFIGDLVFIIMIMRLKKIKRKNS